MRGDTEMKRRFGDARRFGDEEGRPRQEGGVNPAAEA